jgi:hypothetical protein
MTARTDFPRDVAAVHEASHVAAAIALGIPIVRVSIDRNDPHRPGAIELELVELVVNKRRASRSCVLLLAGREGEKLYFKEPLPEGSDYEDLKLVERILLEAGYARITLPSRIAHLRRRAYYLVREQEVRQNIELLRKYLLLNGKLSAQFIDTFRVGRAQSPRAGRP